MARPDAWFRLYNGAVDNPKVQRLPPPLFKVWINLLCVASRHGGRLPPLADVAFILRVKESQARNWLSALERHRLFERDADGVVAPHDWDTLQFKTDTSKLRTRQYRERRKAGDDASDGVCDVTSDAGVTAPEQSRPEQIKTDSPLSPPGGGDTDKDFSEGFSEEFLKFWEAYPEKVGQKAAWKAWRRAEDRPTAAVILAAVDRYVRTKPSDRAWCNPSTWLRQGRWADARETSPPSPDTPKIFAGRTEDQWRWGAKLYAQKKYWPPSFGPAPGTGGCACPAAVLAAFKLTR